MFLAIPKFETPRLILKGIQLADARNYEKHFVDYEVIRHLSSLVPWPYPLGGIEAFLRDVVLPVQGVSRWLWGIFLKENPGEVIGCVDLWREGRPENRGFWLGREFWGQGLMTEAVQPTVSCAFEVLEFERLVFSNALGNLKSRRIKEKTGARMIGTRPAKFVDAQYDTAETWELTRKAWENFLKK